MYDTLVLSGASVKGLLILGALQRCYDLHLLDDVKTYIGVSAGALTNFLLCIGYTPIEIAIYICTSGIVERMKNSINLASMVQMKGAIPFKLLRDELEKIILAKIGYIPTLSQLKKDTNKTFICLAFNYTDKKVEQISTETHGDMCSLDVLQMTSNLPMIFEHFEYRNTIWLDAGFIRNFPIEIGDYMGEKVLGITIAGENHELHLDSPVDFIYDLLFLANHFFDEDKTRNVSDKCKIIKLESSLKFFNFDIDTKQLLELFSYGYKKMEENNNLDTERLKT